MLMTIILWAALAMEPSGSPIKPGPGLKVVASMQVEAEDVAQ
jgi:hypothetical protein